jgi:hypothetical protein
VKGYNPSSFEEDFGMATATFTQSVTLQHRANLGEEPETVDFAEGDKVTILKEWSDRYLCKSDGGQIFNVPKTYVSVG